MWLADVLAQRVKETGGNQAAYARSLGMTPQTLNAMIQGSIKVPNPDSRRRIARDLGMTHVALLVRLGELAEAEATPPAMQPVPFPPGSLGAYAVELLRRLTDDGLRIAVVTLEAYAGPPSTEPIADRLRRIAEWPATDNP
jgi:transcriptional regulator with XRE-family HTH domain